MGIQLGSHFQGMIINIIIDNMKTILAFLALAALATARPEGRQAQVCPPATPLPCEDYCVAAQAECPVPINRQTQVCPPATPLPCEDYCVAAQAKCPVPVNRQTQVCPLATPLPCEDYCVA